MRSILLLTLAAGCTGDLIELNNNFDAGAADTGSVAPKGSGDGGALVFDDVFADVKQLGCTASSCHGGTTTPVLKDAFDPATRTANYNNFTADAMNGESSSVLTRNLSGNGLAHTGGKPFASKSDPVYQRWLAWINAGNLN